MIKVVGGKSLVASEGRVVRCDLRARIHRKLGKRLAVGDEVELLITEEPAPQEPSEAPGDEAPGDEASDEEGDEQLPEGVIEKILPRRSALRRVRDFKRDQIVCANVDRVFVVTAVLDPPYKRNFIDRVIVGCERDGLEPFLVFNKVDLADDAYAELIAADVRVYTEIGYPALCVSASAGFGTDQLAEAFRGRISAVVGPSGVGKSTLLNEICPGLNLRTGAVSEHDGRGRHTTTAAELIPLPSGDGYVVDTPGLRGFGLWDLAPGDVARGFREISEVAAGCKFRNCLHKSEPSCAVRLALEEGEVDEERFESYLRLVEELESAPEHRQASRRR